MVPRTRVAAADGVDGDIRSKGALEILLDLLDLYPTLDGAAPLMQTYSVVGWRVINRRETTHALRVIVAGVGRNPLRYALHSGRIGGATQLAAQGATNVQIQRADRWKSLAFMAYCYESLERLIGISHKHWNHGKINGGQKLHYPFRHPKWRYPYLEGLSTRPPYSLTLFLLSSPPIHSHSNLANR